MDKCDQYDFQPAAKALSAAIIARHNQCVLDEGRKDDTGKDPWHLTPWDAVRCIIRVLGFGANKYAPRNWEKGMDWSRPFAAVQRHLTAWWHKENGGIDAETGYSHLWHAGCCILFLIAYELRGVGQDDRP